MRAAARFTDFAGYSAAVLHGSVHAPAHVPSVAGPSANSYSYGVGATLGAVAVAALALLPGGDRRLRAFAPLSRPLAALRAAHSGRAGDYVAWLTAGATVIGGAFALTLT
jgi:hypothetical protein